MPLYYSAFYEMQSVFWRTVVIGGLLTNMKLSAYLMNVALTNSGEYDQDGELLIIEDESVSKILFENDEFKEKINSFLKGKNLNIKNRLTRFSSRDLLLSIHDFTLNLNAKKMKSKNWHLDVEIIDRYDFTDIKNSSTTQFIFMILIITFYIMYMLIFSENKI